MNIKQLEKGGRNMDKQNYKTVPISRQMVWESYLQVRKKGKAAGVDGISQEKFDENLKDNLYKLWNRLTSGSYYPPAVRQVEIEKENGGTRKLGIPTISDRIAQTVIKREIEERLEEEFEESSYGYRRGRSAHDALKKVKENVKKKSWLVDLDIKGFFDNLDHELLKLAIERHVEEKWIKMYIKRWLEVSIQKEGEIEEKKVGKGISQGGVISPVLSNLYLHYTLDKWLKNKYPEVELIRYSDDGVIHCKTKEKAEEVLEAVRKRLKECRLELHPEKTKIVYCKRERRGGNYPIVKFDFLGHSFKPKMLKSKYGFYLEYVSSMSNKAKQKIQNILRKMEIHRWSRYKIEEIAEKLNPKLRGWINYYGKHGGHDIRSLFRGLDHRLMKWLLKRYKKLKGRKKVGYKVLKRIRREYPNILEHWKKNCSSLS